MARIYNDITETIGKGKTIVAIVPSSSERYLSTWLFADIGTESDDISSLLTAA